jgi:hypothetical protein
MYYNIKNFYGKDIENEIIVLLRIYFTSLYIIKLNEILVKIPCPKYDFCFRKSHI